MPKLNFSTEAGMRDALDLGNIPPGTSTPAEDIAAIDAELAQWSTRSGKGVAEAVEALRAEKARLVAQQPTGTAPTAPMPAVPAGAPTTVSTATSTGPKGTSTKVTTKNYGAAGEELKGAVNAFQESAKAHLQTLADIVTGSGLTTEAINAAANTQGEQQALATSLQGDINVATLLKKQSVLNFAGVNVDDPTSRVVEASQRIHEADRVMNSLRDEIDTESNVSFFNDPLRWLGNQITLPAKMQEYNAAHYKRQQAHQSIKEATEEATALANTNPAAITATIQQQAAAQASAEKAKALLEAHKADQLHASHKAQLVMQQVNVLGMSLDAQARLASMLSTTESVSAADKPYEDILANANQKLIAMGAPPIANAAQLKAMSPEQRQMIMKHGAMSLGIFGENLGEGLKFIDSQGASASFLTKSPEIAELLGKIQKDPLFKTVSSAVTQDPKWAHAKEEDQRAEIYARYQKAAEKGMQGEGINKLDQNNPYRLKFANAVLLPQNKDNAVAKATGALLDTRQQVTDKHVWDSFIGIVRAEQAKPATDPTKKSPKQLAKEFVDFYKGSAEAQRHMTGMSKFNFAPQQTYYLANVTEYGDIDIPEKLKKHYMPDAFSQASVESALMRELSYYNRRRNMEFQGLRGNAMFMGVPR